ADTGLGIPADMLDKVFDIFMQVNPTIARSEGGLGIGLTLVRRLIELHGGKARASSAGVGKGSEFEVRLPAIIRKPLPIVKSPAELAGSESDRAVQPIDRHRVLVVEDNVYAAKSFATLLRLDGHEVQVAHDGPEALQTAEKFRPDVILLDIGLPGIDGYEVAQRLRAKPEFKETQLIAMTGYGQPEDRRRSREAGIDHHLVKPVKIDFVRALLAGGEPSSGTISPSASTARSTLVGGSVNVGS
ncbi:MAG TPA: response regulator, partial [Pirellulales bacterium]|nr:response regulator [Pirellulales bacterium]